MDDKPTLTIISTEQAIQEMKECGILPQDCICDPFDLAALGHMTNCPCYVSKEHSDETNT